MSEAVLVDEPRILVREALAEDLEGFWHVVGVVYNDGRSFPEERRTSEARRHFVAFVDGIPAGGFNIMNLQSTRGLGTLLNGGIAMVAVLPEYRNSGVASAMMTYALEVMRSEGYPISSLYGFAERFYRRFGFETCGGSMKISVPLASMPRPKPQLDVRQIHCYDEIQACYENYARARSGLTIRDGFWWERKVGDAMIYGCGDPVEAYVIVQYRTGFHDPLEFREFIWNSEPGYESMLRFMSDLGANRGTIIWREGSESPFFYRFLPRRSQVEVTSEGAAMFRVVNVPKALEALVPSAQGEFTLRLVDPTLPENEGPWLVQFSPSQVIVSPADDADLVMDVRAFTQALLGQPSLADQIRNGFVEVNDAVRAESAIRLLPSVPVALYDFF